MWIKGNIQSLSLCLNGSFSQVQIDHGHARLHLMLFTIPKFPVLFNDVEEDRFCLRGASRALVDIFLIQPLGT